MRIGGEDLMAYSRHESIWHYIEVLTLIMVSVTPWIPQAVKIILLGGLIAINIVRVQQLKGHLCVSVSFVIVAFMFLIPSLVDLIHVSNSNSYSAVNFLYPINFLCGYLIATKYGKDEFCLVMEKIVFVLALLSLVGMSIYYINPSLIRSFPSYTYYESVNRTIFFFNYQFVDDWMSMRNAGIAWEPGVFQIILNLGLCVSIPKFKGKSRLIRVVVYTLAIILTRSTMGFIILMVNIVYLLKEEKKYWILLTFIIIAFSASVASELQYQLSNKLFGSSSFSYRYSPLINAIKYTWYKPLGIGSTGYNAVYQQMNLGSFDAYTQILMRYGYPLLIYIVCKLRKLRKNDFFLGVTMFLALFSSPVWGSAFFVVFYYLNDREEKRRHVQ